MENKMWAGRFQKQPDKILDDFNSSIHFDKRLYRSDIAGSVAHATMLYKSGIIEQSEGELIVRTLYELLEDIENNKTQIDMSCEDIHMFVEMELTKRIGESGKRLHTARSRNDQVALDIRMYLRDEIDEIILLLEGLVIILCDKASENLETVMPGYTHLQRAQPITFAHHLMAYSEMLLRDKQRLLDTRKRVNIMPLGNGALAGTTYDIDRNFVKEMLGFSDITQNSLDGVSDRDFVVEALSSISIIMMHLSRFCEEVIMWCSFEFKFLELDDSFATGSSIMPQKKNPDIAELIRGKAGRVYGDLMTILTIMKGTALAYNKDMQEDKEALFDGIDTVKACIRSFTPMIETSRVIKENMRKAAGKGFINATDCADYLVKNSMAFRDAYRITGILVARCIELDKTLEELPLSEYHSASNVFKEDVYKFINLEKCMKDRTVVGGPSPNTVANHIAKVRSSINSI